MNYKMDLSETMKIAALSKSQNSSQQSQENQGYITEKLYMLLQLYLQNKSWNPSIELLSCFSELKDTVLANPAYLQVLSSRIALDSQGRLVLRDSGKMILPYEHFSNAVMLRHLSGGPHGLHLSVEATVRSVMESYTIGRDNFGMEKDFIIEVVTACPSSACRYYKGHMGTFMDQSFAGSQMSADYLSHLQQLGGAAGNPELAALDYNKAANSMSKFSKSNQQSLQQQQQITAAIIQQQNRAMAAQQSLEKFGNLTQLEKQRILQQLDKKHYETVAAVAQANNLSQSLAAQNNLSMINNQMAGSSSTPHSISQLTQQHPPQSAPTPIHHSAPSQPTPIPIPPMDSSHKNSDYGRSSYDGGIESYSAAHYSTSNRDLLALHNGAWTNNNSSSNNLLNNSSSTTNSTSASILNNSSTTPTTENRESMVVSQDKIIRAFAELMRNMARMKTFIRPSMVKPYGKQSESLQKTLMDTIQLVQSLRNCLPPPHISVGNWKSEDRLRKEAAEAEQLNINRPIQ